MDNPQTFSESYFYHLDQLAKTIKYESRYVLPERYNLFVRKILHYISSKFSSVIPSKSILYRARINPIDFIKRHNESKPFPPEKMGTPPRSLSISGRINPEGIPYLYCSGEINTAGAELRPWKNSYLTIAEIRIEHDLNIVDLTIDEDDQDADWGLFIYDFQELFTKQWPPESKLNYLVTQFFSEHFKLDGFRGVKYKSDFNNGGNNFALFHKEDYSIVKTFVVEAYEVDYSFFAIK
ncbi:MAG: RES family NAD+ phosphorylase [Desulfobacteraceae bacterium]|nr:RES family NAD+ phosphorylase [Desulfobacteraceae bacterium]MBC2748756.1 RES family NAD+ phosphorylase [Desulfobacteraceae bacterium]